MQELRMVLSILECAWMIMNIEILQNKQVEYYRINRFPKINEIDKGKSIIHWQ